MIVDDPFLDQFTALILQAEGKRPPAPASWEPVEVPIKSLLDLLKRLLNQNVTFDTTEVRSAFSQLLTGMRPDKRIKYGEPIKFAMKRLKGEADHIFALLKTIPGVEKLSKSQQRYTYDMVEGDHGPGLCAPLAVMWLKERLEFHFKTQFPRLKGESVLGSERALSTTAKAVAVGSAFLNAEKVRDKAKVPDVAERAEHMAAAQLGLVLTDVGKPSFNSVHETFRSRVRGSDLPAIDALLISFCTGRHAVALIKESSSSFQFYDANAGSYRIPADQLRTFFLTYNDQCLRLKWPEYHDPVTKAFYACYSVTKRAG